MDRQKDLSSTGEGCCGDLLERVDGAGTSLHHWLGPSCDRGFPLSYLCFVLSQLISVWKYSLPLKDGLPRLPWALHRQRPLVRGSSGGWRPSTSWKNVIQGNQCISLQTLIWKWDVWDFRCQKDTSTHHWCPKFARKFLACSSARKQKIRGEKRKSETKLISMQL